MELTVGTVLFCGGIVGAAACLIALLATWKIFAVQRKRMLEFLEKL